jgi:hypothetical protein
VPPILWYFLQLLGARFFDGRRFGVHIKISLQRKKTMNGHD